MTGDYVTTDELTTEVEQLRKENARLQVRVAELEEAVGQARDLAAELAQPARRTRATS